MTHPPIEISAIGQERRDEAFALFSSNIGDLPPGHLNDDSREQFQALLETSGNLCLGAFSGDRLIGYSLTKITPLAKLTVRQFFLCPEGRDQLVGYAAGTLIDPAHQGRHLSVRLFKARRAALAQRGVEHTFGRAGVKNHESLGAYLRAGSLLCGFDVDEYGLYLIHYSGPLADTRVNAETGLWADDLAEMDLLFRQGYVARRMRRLRRPEGRRASYWMTQDFGPRTAIRPDESGLQPPKAIV